VWGRASRKPALSEVEGSRRFCETWEHQPTWGQPPSRESSLSAWGQPPSAVQWSEARQGFAMWARASPLVLRRKRIGLSPARQPPHSSPPKEQHMSARRVSAGHKAHQQPAPKGRNRGRSQRRNERGTIWHSGSCVRAWLQPCRKIPFPCHPERSPRFRFAKPRTQSRDPLHSRSGRRRLTLPKLIQKQI